jgi:hypothetical protein
VGFRNVGERFGRHHPAGKRIDATGACRRIIDGLAIQDERRHVLHQFQARPLPIRLIGPPIVNLCHFRAQSADVSGEIQSLLAAKLVKHPERFLRFAQSENRNQRAAPTAKGCFNCGRQFFFFRCA